MTESGQTPDQPADYGAPLPPPPVAGAPVPPPVGGYSAPPPGYSQPGYSQPASAQPGSAGFDPKSLQNFDPKTVNPLDWGIIGAGLVAFIFSTFSFYKYSVSFTVADLTGGGSASVSAWHGFFGWFGVLVALLASIALAVQLIAKITLPIPLRTVVLGAFALAALCLLLALFVVPGDTGSAGALGVKVDKGHGFGYWITFIAVLAGTGLSYVRFTAFGGKLPKRG